MKGSFVTVVVILVLSLAVWSVIYATSKPLKDDETTVVVGICVVIVLFAKWVWSRGKQKVGKK